MLDFSMVAGSTLSVEISVTTDLDLQTASEITWTLGECCDNPEVTKTKTGGGIVVLNATKFRVSLASADTQDLDGQYCHQAWVDIGSGHFPVRNEDNSKGTVTINK